MDCLKNCSTYALAVLLSMACVQANADTGPVVNGEQNSAMLLSQSSRSMSADRAAALVRESTGGRILSVDKRQQNGGAVYRVKVLMSDGRVRVIRVNAQTGRISG